jgi:hypothetical protein
VEMPAGVAAASDEAGRGVPGPTTGRPGVPRRGGVGGGTLELLRSGDGVRRAASWRVRRKPRAREAGPTRRLGEMMRRTRLELDVPLGRVNVDDSVSGFITHTASHKE